MQALAPFPLLRPTRLEAQLKNNSKITGAGLLNAHMFAENNRLTSLAPLLMDFARLNG